MRPAFETPIAICGIAGVLGAAGFGGSVLFLQIVRADVDWARNYVSDLANGRLGWLFVAASVVHGLGNLATALGLRLALERSRLRDWAAFIFALASAGILVGGLVATDSPGQAPTTAGGVHRAVASISIPLQWVAVLLFSVEFARQPLWRRRQRAFLVLASIATVAMVGLLVALRLGSMTGLAERLALVSLLTWELWAALALTGRPGATPVAEASG